ncbi:MAG: DNA methylase [Lachnospiraceae bacterium]|nr:DNA methylase [Lachnospiraceae bacterium]
MMSEKTYIAIDLKSFYASVECIERGLDPLKTNLVVADVSRTEKTICLAVSPALKKYGIPGRPRLFEVVQKVREANIRREKQAPYHRFCGTSFDEMELNRSPELKISYIAAAPRMACYMEYSTKIFDIYLRYIAPEDMHVYSVDEVFIDATAYLHTYGLTAHELALRMIRDVLRETGVTATAGIGTNMYLCKIAMDIVAKKMPPDEDGVRIAELDEESYRKQLWNHVPLTDFWRVGPGYAKKLKEVGIYTMGDVARCSLGKDTDYYNEDLLYKLFGINAELLIDHAWGWEPTTIAEIKSYRPEKNSLSTGQVLQCPYTAQKAKLIVREMTDLLVLDLVDKKLVTDQMVLTVGYDIESLTNPEIRRKYHGEVTTDRYGRHVPKHAHGTANLSCQTSSTKLIMKAVEELYDRIINPDLLVRRITVVASRVVPESEAEQKEVFEQLDLFTDYQALEQEREQEKKELDKEKRIQKAILDIQKKYGKNAVLKGMNFEEGATTRERNGQIGGHKA